MREKSGWGKKAVLLLGSGLFMGVGIGCKWSGCYSALGLAALFFWSFGEGRRKGWIGRREAAKTLLLCTAAFFLVPSLLYILSYIPYVSLEPDAGFWQEMISNQKNMLLYHITYSYDHPSASMWYQWPLTIRPVTMVYGIHDGSVEVMKAMGNPAVWWTGTAAVFWGMAEAAGNRDRTAARLLLSYGSQLLPWVLISRASFLYHYFPALIFSVILAAYWASKGGKRRVCLLGAAVVLAAAAFAVYYPVIAGRPVSFQTLLALDWFPGWDLTQH